MCFEEFTTSPYEMLLLVKEFFQDINQLLQNQETFEKDCSQVYRRTCLGPRKGESSPGEMMRLYLTLGGLDLPAWSSLRAACPRPWAHAGAVGTARVWSSSLSLGWWPLPWGGLGAVSASSVSVSSWGGERGLVTLWRWGLGRILPETGPGQSGVLRGSKEVSPPAWLEASRSARSQSPSTRLSVTRRD